MLEMQEKLRKSEEERIRLEERFKVLLQESHNRHNESVNRLRFRYIEFLEEQRTTHERNYKLLEALDKVDNSLALITARTDRLNVLRKHYEAYLRQIYGVHSSPGNTADIDDNYVSDQTNNRHLRKSADEHQNHLPPEVKNMSPRRLFRPNYETSSLTTLRMSPKFPQSTLQQSPLPNLPSPAFQRGQAYYYTEINLPRETNVEHFDQIFPQRMNTIQTAPHLVTPDYSSSNIPQSKSLEVSQNRSGPSSSQYYINPTYTQSFQQQSSGMSLDTVQTEMKSGNERSFCFQDTPASMERNVSDISSMNVSVNLDKKLVPNYMHYSLKNSKYSQESTAESLQSPVTRSHDEHIMKRHVVPKYLNDIDACRFSKDTAQIHVEGMEGKVPIVIDDEFDRYMDKIRKLHHDLDEESSQRIRQQQNTNNGDFNKRSLNDEPEILTDANRGEYIQQEDEKLLVLGKNLVSETVNVNDVGKDEDDRNRNLELVRTTRNYAPNSERIHVEISDAHEGHVASMAYAKDRISNDITSRKPDLDSHQNIGKPKNQNSDNLGDVLILDQVDESLSETQRDKFVHSVEDNDFCTAEESQLEQYLFNAVEELEPWSLNHVEKQIKEIDLLDEIENHTGNKDSVGNKPTLDENDTKNIESDDMEENITDKGDVINSTDVEEVILNDINDRLELRNSEGLVDKNEIETSQISTSQFQESQQEDEDAEGSLNYKNMVQNVVLSNKELDEQNDHDDKRTEEYSENNHMSGVINESNINENNEQEIILGEEYNNKNYEESDQAQSYAHNTEIQYSDSREGYNYNQKESYGNNENYKYQGYTNQIYEQGSNEHYGGHTSEQYGDDINDPENLHQHDSNAQYQEDSEEQYNPSQEHVTTDTNQHYEFNEAEVSQEQEYKVEQEENEKYKELQEESKSEEVKDDLEKVNEGQSGTVSSENARKEKKDVIKSLLDSDSESTIERNISNTESDFDFN
ncbi:hypothetical protein WN55_06223 [Dufourea novaeangliae]|uniref:Uncharacterized protein n=2 Tax=Dufourea novaeangliae TaxID=178035 RepID=A0A154PQK9_DUFNO|nr:hypothetical protein WN55_06223 [Dufourea novaeangliae]